MELLSMYAVYQAWYMRTYLQWRAVDWQARKLRQDLEDDRDRRSIIDKYSHSPRSSTPLSNGPTDSQSSDSQFTVFVAAI